MMCRRVWGLHAAVVVLMTLPQLRAFNDCNWNGLEDWDEIRAGLVTDCNSNGTPDECDVRLWNEDCDGNGIVDDCEPLIDCNGNRVFDACEVRTWHVDCDANGIPDECEPIVDCDGDGERDACQVLDLRTDCDGSGIPDACEPVVDCDGNGVRDACDARDDQKDCDRNGIPDACELFIDCDGNGLRDACDLRQGLGRDCDRNRILDSCDLAAGRATDEDENGVLDACDPPVSFRFAFRGPIRLHESADEGNLFEAAATMEQRVRVPGITHGAQGWSIVVAASGCIITGATTAGTAGAPVSEGGYLRNGFSRTSVLRDGTAAYTAIVLTTQGEEGAELPPAGGPHDILRLTARTEAATAGGCTPCTFFHTGGWPGLEQWIGTVVTLEGSSAPVEENNGSFCPGFRRGDVNSDTKVDISDPIRLLMSLFLGAPAPSCLDAADATDDGRVDISDGIFLLGDLFRGELGSVILSPGPFLCGLDPTGDGLDCAEFKGCP